MRSRSPSPAPSRSYTTTRAPPPAQHAPAPPPAQQRSGGMMAGLGGMMAQGMAIGTGSGLAHAAIDRVFSSKHPEPAEAAQAAQQIAAAPAADEPCRIPAKSFMDCLESNNGEMDSCRYYFDQLQSCKLDSRPALGY